VATEIQIRLADVQQGKVALEDGQALAIGCAQSAPN
jgi:hypothetical protein